MASLLPADAEMHIKAILQGQDLTTMSLKEVRAQLETKLGKEAGSLDPAKGEIKVLVSAEISRQQAEEGGSGSSSGSEGEEKESKGATSKQGTKRGRDDEAAAKPKRSVSDGPIEKKKRVQKGEGKGAGLRQSSAMTRQAFMDTAQAFKVNIGGKEVKVPPKKFSTGSCGFYQNTKVQLDVDGQSLVLQCQFSCQIIGSKQWEDE